MDGVIGKYERRAMRIIGGKCVRVLIGGKEYGLDVVCWKGGCKKLLLWL